LITGSNQRSEPTASRLCAALFLAFSVWGLLLGLPTALEPIAGADRARLGAFLAAAALVIGIPSRARDRFSGRAIGLLALGGIAGFAGYPAAIACFTASAGTAGWAALGAVAPETGGAARGAVAILLAPVLEELLYREHLLLALRAAAGGCLAVPIASLLFALPHLAPPMVLASFFTGLVLGIARLLSGSIALCIGIHAGLNAAAFVCGHPPLRWALPVGWSAALATASLLWARRLVQDGSGGRRVAPVSGRAVRGGAPARRRTSRCAVLISASLAVATAGTAGEMRWSGTLSLDLVSPGLPLVSIPGTGVATVNAAGGGFGPTSLRLAGGVTGTASAPVTDPDAVASIRSVRGSVTLGTGALRPFSPSAPLGEVQLTQRTLPVRGSARLCLFFSGCQSALTLPLTVADGRTGLGVGGSWTVGGFGAVRISIEAAPWTPRTASVIVTTESGETVGVPAAGWIHGPFSLATTAALTSGAISLVTPMRIAFSGGQQLPAFGRLTLRFVPEPGLLPSLAAGIAALFCLGRNRVRPRQRPARRSP
jgi:membrane protease YdiL (CAAX protease family)